MPLHKFLSMIKQQVKMGRGEVNTSYHTRGRKMNWSLTGVLKVLSNILLGTERIRMNQGSWKDCSIWDHLNICITTQCELSTLPWDPYQKPKRDPWVLWQSLILHHVCMKPVSACPTDRALLPSSRPFSRKKGARQQSPCQLLSTEWWFLVLFVIFQQQFILSYVLNKAWSKVNMYFDR